ncbi:Peptide chain release factor 1 [Pirellula sp. SH-Sr6A]|uniref:peptide chain release factor family protein n=1 Tax=Pirellula sp. SH-Sr6A TaxID=1632865 RepID=UPI00078CFBE4|nr:peptide chain release factor-like protein [Pirellula sp. SH-Sr6A]AMV35747.1 Peptide chain release factor 1 [Pirellula sp. SH-Sr6A]
MVERGIAWAEIDGLHGRIDDAVFVDFPFIFPRYVEPVPTRPRVHPVFQTEAVLLEQCKLTHLRASGPGGQNRNKVETAVEWIHLPSGCRGKASERRSQKENRDVAVHRLREQLAVHVRSEPTEAGRLVTNRYTDGLGRINISEGNWEWPMILAELLNRLAYHQWEIPPAAVELSTTTSQVIKLLRKSRPALEWVNSQRQALGRSALR